MLPKYFCARFVLELIALIETLFAFIYYRVSSSESSDDSDDSPSSSSSSSDERYVCARLGMIFKNTREYEFGYGHK